MSKEEVESFERYAKENEVESDGTQSQWADYTLRLIAMLRQREAECKRLKDDNKKLAYDVAHLVVGRDETITRLRSDLAEAQRKADALDWLEMFVHEHGHIELMNLGCRFGIADCLTHEEYADVDGSLLEAIQKASAGK